MSTAKSRRVALLLAAALQVPLLAVSLPARAASALAAFQSFRDWQAPQNAQRAAALGRLGDVLRVLREVVSSL